jgi:hypothetical protein
VPLVVMSGRLPPLAVEAVPSCVATNNEGDHINVHGNGLGFQEKRCAGDFVGLSDKQESLILLMENTKSSGY